MKHILVGVTILAFLFCSLPAHAQPLEPFGKIELSGGGEKEAHNPSGGRFIAEALGVLPFIGSFGGQGSIHYETGQGSRIGFNAGPLIAWDGGKAGFFFNYQHRGLRSTDFLWLIPSVALYLPQWNLNMWYSHPVTGAQRGGGRVEYGVNRLQFTASYFSAVDWAPFLRRDNVELTGGLQVNTFAGAGHDKVGGTGVGPVLGIAFIPMPGVVVDLIHAVVDHVGRYRVTTGLEFFFDPKGNWTLLQERRKSLEPNFAGPQWTGEARHHAVERCITNCTSDRNLKTNIEPIDQREVLARLTRMPIQQWNYNADDPSVRHIGPMAQDFYASFGLGDSDKTINMVDGNGVALASIQALYQIVQEKDQKITSLESRLAQLEKGKSRSPLDDIAAAWPLIALVAVGGVFIARRKLN